MVGGLMAEVVSRGGGCLRFCGRSAEPGALGVPLSRTGSSVCALERQRLLQFDRGLEVKVLGVAVIKSGGVRPTKRLAARLLLVGPLRDATST